MSGSSQSRPAEAYIYFVGGHPEHRGQRLGQRLYEAFFRVAPRMVTAALADPAVLVLIEGEAGIGKSRLLRECISSPSPGSSKNPASCAELSNAVYRISANRCSNAS